MTNVKTLLYENKDKLPVNIFIFSAKFMKAI